MHHGQREGKSSFVQVAKAEPLETKENKNEAINSIMVISSSCMHKKQKRSW